MEEKFELLAYHKWLLRESGKDRSTLVGLILSDLSEQNPMAFELLEATGDRTYNADTIFKAADILLNADQR